MIYFTSDFHISHNNILKYCNRPFSSMAEMDATIFDNFFSKIRSNDSVYFLGDFSFNRNAIHHFFGELRKKVKNVNFYFILGNHDYKIKNILPDYCTTVKDQQAISINGQDIFLNHYSMRVWHKSHFNSWQLFGHSHGGLAPEGKQWDVGVDNNNFMPVSFDELKAIMDKRPDNFNLVK